MTDRPPSPDTPSTAPIDTADDRVIATTSQLAARIEDAVGVRLDADVLEELLLELDRDEYVDWVTVTRDGEYCWDLTEAPDRIAEAVAAAVADRVDRWLAARTA